MNNFDCDWRPVDLEKLKNREVYEVNLYNIQLNLSDYFELTDDKTPESITKNSSIVINNITREQFEDLVSGNSSIIYELQMELLDYKINDLSNKRNRLTKEIYDVLFEDKYFLKLSDSGIGFSSLIYDIQEAVEKFYERENK